MEWRECRFLKNGDGGGADANRSAGKDEETVMTGCMRNAGQTRLVTSSVVVMDGFVGRIGPRDRWQAAIWRSTHNRSEHLREQ